MECLDPRIKSCNYLNNILAKIEAKRAGVPEAIMLNLNGRVAECTADNIFITKNGHLLTPRHSALTCRLTLNLKGQPGRTHTTS